MISRTALFLYIDIVTRRDPCTGHWIIWEKIKQQSMCFQVALRIRWCHCCWHKNNVSGRAGVALTNYDTSAASANVDGRASRRCIAFAASAASVGGRASCRLVDCVLTTAWLPSKQIGVCCFRRLGARACVLPISRLRPADDLLAFEMLPELLVPEGSKFAERNEEISAAKQHRCCTRMRCCSTYKDLY